LLGHFLEELAEDPAKRPAKLILNGDVFDSIDFRRLKKSHWKVLSWFRKLADQMDIIWLCGNHDGSADIISHLLGLTVQDEYLLHSGDRHILILHGHVFDEFIDAHPILTWVGDQIYFFLQWIDKTHRFAKLAKKGSKTFLRCAQQIQDKSRDYARKKAAHAVCCGHTHQATAQPDGPVAYYNSGCWTELPCGYLSVAAGEVRLNHVYPDWHPVPRAERQLLIAD
jgi:UDP-2,3-diacylglucosamine pyrophosphatase LpxH